MTAHYHQCPTLRCPKCDSTFFSNAAWREHMKAHKELDADALEQQNRDLREALRYYADERKYEQDEDAREVGVTDYPILHDAGHAARQALAEGEGE